MPLLPPRPPAPADGGHRHAEWMSGDRRHRRGAEKRQQCYPSSWRIAPSGGSGRLVTRLDTPPSSNHHHPASAIAPATSIPAREPHRPSPDPAPGPRSDAEHARVQPGPSPPSSRPHPPRGRFPPPPPL